MKTPIALTIAGSDSGGGAGIQADLKTFSALGVYGASVITALTAQNTREVRAIFDSTPEFIGQQIDCVLEDLRVDAIKIGMLSRPEVIEVVARKIEDYRPAKVVLDPVMVAKSGDHLLHRDAVAHLRERLVPLADLMTPNLPEAAVLLGAGEVKRADELEETARALMGLGAKAVLLKGGHLEGPEAVDVLSLGDEVKILRSPRVATRNTHGTGCTLSSAVAAYLAWGKDLPEAVAAAKRYLSNAIAEADDLGIGKGHGPVHHFHALWSGRGEGHQ